MANKVCEDRLNIVLSELHHVVQPFPRCIEEHELCMQIYAVARVERRNDLEEACVLHES